MYVIAVLASCIEICTYENVAPPYSTYFVVNRTQLIQFVNVATENALDNGIVFGHHQLDDANFTYFYPAIGTYPFTPAADDAVQFFSAVHKHITSLKYLAQSKWLEG